ncbi:unnamed protein product [Cylindrotheca closterium]|uniref:Uncharacterized protein n=1 Tax=Cylindrotheca closterium TaxID=2856 RepID=A0AAD2FQR6_9STRA|nr:unnamed protein product [Cylindrotheca closterium]
MFGKRWTSDTTVRLYTISWDLCNETIVEPDYLDIEPDVGNNIDQKLYGVALYFDPFETTGNLECRHSTMAQVAEKKYPTAQYLLIANTDLVPITKYDEELDSTLALATVTLDDGDAIKNRFGDETVSSIATGSILVTVDATSRFILDTSITLEHIERGATTIITMTQISAFLSFIGSVYVLYTLVGNKQRRSKSMRVPFNRLLLAISIADLMSSLAMMVAGWATPTAPPGNYEGYYSIERWEVKFPRAVGNDAGFQSVMVHSFRFKFYFLVLVLALSTSSSSSAFQHQHSKLQLQPVHQSRRLVNELVSPEASSHKVQHLNTGSSSTRNRASSLLSNVNDTEGATTESESEVERMLFGWNRLVSGEAWGEPSSMQKLWASLEDIVGVWGHVPLIIASFQTAMTGKCNELEYAICVGAVLLTSLAHGKMTYDTPRDWRAPRLAEYRTVYEFSALYLIPFGWLTARIQPHFPMQLEVLDPAMSLLFSAITIYGVAYALYGKGVLEEANSDQNLMDTIDESSRILPSSPAYQKQAQLYLTGNVVINGLACLFIPFAWTLTIRGTEWWERVQMLHPNQQAFLGLSLLVATIGDVSGNLLVRLKQLGGVTASESTVVIGILSNFLLLLFPELVFNGIYSSGVSEIGFYFE